jgi:biofilm PGA synthesis N-glycosyltransferase PgaC
MNVIAGIMAYNEEKTIGKLLDKLIHEPLINEVCVVASGCTDKTVEIVQKYPVRLIIESKRTGKANAINLFLKSTRSDIVVLNSADCIPSVFCFKYLLSELNKPEIGIVGSHHIPVNSTHKLMGKISHILWRLHHLMALEYPKVCEIIAFKRVIDNIDSSTLTDEAEIERKLVKLGYKVGYAPMAIEFNKGPETASDFIKQRKRVYLGHLRLKENGYQVATMKTLLLLKASFKMGSKSIIPLIIAIALEAKARREALIDYKKGNYKSATWDMVTSTKEVN